MNDDLNAVKNGIAMGNSLGRLMLAGMPPSAASPRGAPPPVDPLVGRFNSALGELSALAVGLSRQRDAESLREMVEVQELSTKLQRMAIDRQARIADGGGEGQDLPGQQIPQQQQSNPTNFPNINGGGIVNGRSL